MRTGIFMAQRNHVEATFSAYRILRSHLRNFPYGPLCEATVDSFSRRDRNVNRATRGGWCSKEG